MKKHFTLPLIVLATLTFGCSSDNNEENEPIPEARTTIADPAFEQALIDLNHDDVLDGSVSTSRIDFVKDLVLNDKEIKDISGIEDFEALDNLWLNDNMLTSMDVSKNTKLKFIFIDNNQVATLATGTLPSLEKIGAKNNLLSSLDLSANTALQFLDIPGNNLSSVDVSNNSQLNNFDSTGNPLTCIQVNQTQLNAIPSQWTKDEATSYNIDCN